MKCEATTTERVRCPSCRGSLCRFCGGEGVTDLCSGCYHVVGTEGHVRRHGRVVKETEEPDAGV
jgi:hypothetical protein